MEQKRRPSNATWIILEVPFHSCRNPPVDHFSDTDPDWYDAHLQCNFERRAAAEDRWMSAMLSAPFVICYGVVILAAVLLVAVGLFRALLGWLRFRNLK